MSKYIELYTDEGFAEYLEKAFTMTEKACDNYKGCNGCPFKGEDLCIGSLLGESWRRIKNKIMLDNEGQK